VNDLLDLSTLDKGTFNKNFKVFNWRKSISEVLNINYQQARYKDNKFSILRLGDIPHYIRTDNTRMQQILMNYIGNAIKFTSKGTIEVIVGFQKDPDIANLGKLQISVRDSGCGISAEDQIKLFTPFTMLSANKNMNPNGTGMGLSICKRIAESMGGDVEVKSEPGRGSYFSFSFTCEIPTAKQITEAGLSRNLLEVEKKLLPMNAQEVAKDFQPYTQAFKDDLEQAHDYRPVTNAKQRILVADDMKFVVVAMHALFWNVFKLDSDVVTYVRDG